MTLLETTIVYETSIEIILVNVTIIKKRV